MPDSAFIDSLIHCTVIRGSLGLSKLTFGGALLQTIEKSRLDTGNYELFEKNSMPQRLEGNNHLFEQFTNKNLNVLENLSRTCTLAALSVLVQTAPS